MDVELPRDYILSIQLFKKVPVFLATLETSENPYCENWWSLSM